MLSIQAVTPFQSSQPQRCPPHLSVASTHSSCPSTVYPYAAWVLSPPGCPRLLQYADACPWDGFRAGSSVCVGGGGRRAGVWLYHFVMSFNTEGASCSPQFNLSQFLVSRDLVILKPHGILITALLLIIGIGVKETSRVLSPARERQGTWLFLHTLGCVSRSDKPHLQQ